MNFKNSQKFVRFREWNSEKYGSPEESYVYGNKDGVLHGKIIPDFGAIRGGIRGEFVRGSERIRKLIVKPHKSSSLINRAVKLFSREGPILDPEVPFLQRWSKIFLVFCWIALAIDPLFFYIPVIDGKMKCFDLDKKMEITACILRTAVDLLYIYHIVLQFRTGFIAPSSRVFGRGELVDDPFTIAKRYIFSYFIVDILAIIPLPQIVVLVVIPSLDGQVALTTKEILKFTVYSQYVPRIIRMYPLYKQVTRTSGMITEIAWAKAAFNLFLYMLFSHVAGAFWYLFSIERKDTCWRMACHRLQLDWKLLYCGENNTANDFLNTSCLPIQPDGNANSTEFNFGIFIDALQSHIVESRGFSNKFFYCFWWGLRNLSSLGQNLQTSTYVSEIVFAVGIAIFGLVLFALLIGNMQKYLQSTTVRIEEMRVKRRDAEQWMSHRMLPDSLRERIRRYEQYKWQETRGVEEESLIHNLPKDLRRDIKRHLCHDLVMQVHMFKKMDGQLLDALCDRLKPVLYTEKSSILREGDPVDEMLFIIRGNSLTMTTNGGRMGFFNSDYLKAGDFCGEELLTWALDPNSSSILPSSTRTVETITEVEAFALTAEDLKFVASQFRHLNSKQLQHTFRFYSQHWKTWAACFIQAAWRNHCKRKLDNAIRDAEDRLQDALSKEGSNTISLGATIHASRFAANALRVIRNGGPRSGKMRPRLPPLLPQKPAEPNFAAHSG